MIISSMDLRRDADGLDRCENVKPMNRGWILKARGSLFPVLRFPDRAPAVCGGRGKSPRARVIMPARRRRCVKTRFSSMRAHPNQWKFVQKLMPTTDTQSKLGPRFRSIAASGVAMPDKPLTLRLRPGEIDAVKGRCYNGPGVEVIIIDDAITTGFALHDSSPCDRC
jgi:hypothetical protein